MVAGCATCRFSNHGCHGWTTRSKCETGSDAQAKSRVGGWSWLSGYTTGNYEKRLCSIQPGDLPIATCGLRPSGNQVCVRDNPELLPVPSSQGAKIALYLLPMRAFVFLLAGLLVPSFVGNAQNSTCVSFQENGDEVIVRAESWDPVSAIGRALARRYGIDVSVEAPKWAFPGELARLDPQQSLIVEMRFFGGLSIEDTAEIIGISRTTVKREWANARAWLRREISRREARA